MSGEQVGLRDFNEHTSRYVHRVRETGIPIDITYHGRPVARLVPSQPPSDQVGVETWLREVDEFAERLSADWPEGVSALEAVLEQRREL